ncbi:hypothetical protein DYB32_008459 [Aphanomyces invadans]|uniref:Uncharacterized protein n=1 Tax=Aphanomyces invadans TaxID=157072 RepID=A0A418AL31_9STRA|nr:hypothetical protein DYB32_008459 [Aphanomyces invadans]
MIITHYSMATPYAPPSPPPPAPRDLTPLMVAVLAGNQAAVDRLLVDPAVDVNEADEEGNTAIFLACGARREAIVLRFLAHPRLDLDHTNLELATVFHVACLHGLVEAVRRLADHPNVFVNQGNCNCYTLPHSKRNQRESYLGEVVMDASDLMGSVINIVGMLGGANKRKADEIAPDEAETPEPFEAVQAASSWMKRPEGQAELERIAARGMLEGALQTKGSLEAVEQLLRERREEEAARKADEAEQAAQEEQRRLREVEAAARAQSAELPGAATTT